MAHETNLKSVELGGYTFESGETELYATEDFAGISEGVYLQVDQIYEVDGDTFVTFKHARAVGPEVDVSLQKVVNAIGSALEFREYDSQMHD